MEVIIICYTNVRTKRLSKMINETKTPLLDSDDKRVKRSIHFL